MIYFVSGPPGSGKTTLCETLIKTHEFGLHLPVDDLRLWVKSGLSESVPWTDETERQFQVAEEAVCGVARAYSKAGFTVAIDHCRNPTRLDEVIATYLTDFPITKVLLLPSMEVNLQRNAQRTNKDFDPAILTETIQFTNQAYRASVTSDWLAIDNSALTIEETMRKVNNHFG